MTPQPKDTAANLYALTSKQVEFLRQLLEAVPLSGNRQQLAVTLAMMDTIKVSLSSPVEQKGKP